MSKNHNPLRIQVKVSLPRAGEFLAFIPLPVNTELGAINASDRNLRDEIEAEALRNVLDVIKVTPLKGEVVRVIKALRAREARSEGK